MEHIVGIGGFAVSNNGSDVIKTFALSTCVGVVYYSMRKRCMGMVHIQLPNSRAAKAEDKPCRFADTAPKFLLEEMINKFSVTRGEMLISIYGGIDGRGDSDCFRIGEKNLVVVKQAFKTLGLVYNEVDTGGQDSRTLVAYVDSGIVEVIKRPMCLGDIAPVRAAGTTASRPPSSIVGGMRPGSTAPAGGFMNRGAAGGTTGGIGARPAGGGQPPRPMGIVLGGGTKQIPK